MAVRVNISRLFLLVAVSGLMGCFSLGREAPVERHYVLGGSTTLDAFVPSDRLSGLRIGLRQPQLAEYLESPLIVVREGQHQIRYSEFHRWGGTLSSGLSRALARYLTALAPFDNVDVAPWAPRATHDYLIQIHLLHMEGLVPDAANSEGGAHVMASWEIVHPRDGTVLARGFTNYEEDGWSVGDYTNLVDRLDAGVWELSRDLVAALETLGGP